MKKVLAEIKRHISVVQSNWNEEERTGLQMDKSNQPVESITVAQGSACSSPYQDGEDTKDKASRRIRASHLIHVVGKYAPLPRDTCDQSGKSLLQENL